MSFTLHNIPIENPPHHHHHVLFPTAKSNRRRNRRQYWQVRHPFPRRVAEVDEQVE